MKKYCHLENYTCIEIHGEKALEFLQGQFTNNLLTHDKSLFCNIKGRIISMLYIAQTENRLFMILNKDCWPKTESLLIKGAMLSKVSFEEKNDMPIYGIIDHDVFSITHDGTLIEGLEPISYTQWHLQKILKKEFELYPTTIGLFLPHDLGLESKSWIDFNKGCYRGQEIIARMHYLGKSKYHLVLLEDDNLNKLLPGESILKDNIEIGTVVDKVLNYTLACMRK
jgi:folate-binding protein YgfZ